MARRARHESKGKKPQTPIEPETQKLQGESSQTLQRTNSEANVSELETMLANTRQELETAKTKIQELESNASRSASQIDNLQNELSKSVPREELDAVKAQLDSKNASLEQKLASYVPLNEVKALKTTIAQLEKKLAESVPKNEASAFSENASRLEAMLNETREKLASVEADKQSLESKLADSVPRSELESAKASAETRINELQARLSESKAEVEPLEVAEPESQMVDTELEVPTEHTEDIESAEPSTTGIEENAMMPACPSCNASVIQGDMYCGNCGTLL